MSNEARAIFVKNLRKYMEQRGKTQTDIANALDVSISTVSCWYYGKSYPRVDVMQRLADYLGVHMHQLTNDEDEEPLNETLFERPGMKVLFRALDGVTDQQIKMLLDVVEAWKKNGKE